MSPQNEPRLTKAERTSQAREKAKIIREAQLKKEKRNSWLIRGGVLVAAVAIVVVIALIIIQTNKNNEPVASTGPVAANMNAYGGVTIGKAAAVIPPTTTEKTVDITKLGALPTSKPDKATGLDEIGIKASAKGQPVQMVMYLDFMCPACSGFEKQYGATIDSLREEGKITVEYRPLGFLDTLSSGTNYSSRAGAAAACVADTSPSSYKKYFDTLYANQPGENSKGLDNATLVKYATESGAPDISSCVNAKTYRPFMANTTKLATVHSIVATPTVFMDGQQWQDGTFDAFYAKILAAKK